MTRIRLCVLVALFAALPTAARAQGGFLDFMEQLSGPGPFNYGGAFEVRLACAMAQDHEARRERRAALPQIEQDANQVPRIYAGWFHKDPETTTTTPSAEVKTSKTNVAASDKTHPCAVRSTDVIAYLEVRFAHASTDVRPLFLDKPNEFVGHTSSYLVQALMMRQLDPAFSAGVGAGVMWFGGDTLDGRAARMVLTPIAIDVTPLRLFLPQNRIARILVFHFQESAFVGTVRATDFNSKSTSTYESHTELFRSFGLNFDVLAALYKQ